MKYKVDMEIEVPSTTSEEDIEELLDKFVELMEVEECIVKYNLEVKSK